MFILFRVVVVVKPSAFWWSIMSIPGTPICSTFPSTNKLGQKMGQKKSVIPEHLLPTMLVC